MTKIHELVGLLDAFYSARYEGDARMLAPWRGQCAVGKISPRTRRNAGGAAEAPAPP